MSGSNRTDAALKDLLFYKQFNTPCTPMAIRQEWLQHLEDLTASISSDPRLSGRLLQLYGEEGMGKRTLIENLGARLEMNLCFIEMNRIYELGYEQAKLLIPSILLEVYLKNAILCFRIRRPRRGTEETLWETFLSRFLTELREYLGFSILLSEDKHLFVGQETQLSLLSLELPPLTVQENLTLWKYFSSAMSLSQEVKLACYANKYSFSIARIQAVLETAACYGVYEAQQEVRAADIDRAVKQLNATTLGAFASYVKPAFTWEDLVIGESQQQMLRYLCDCVRYKSVVEDDWGFRRKLPYGRGMTAAFYGPPGTGKTMAVQVLASELKLDFYRVDLSQMVSKYIGETEKNITRLFQEAKSINAALFFDEADAFFSKRTEISNSNDKNANNETAHLLQQVEDFDGLVILATNYIANIDEAFKRRIRLSVNFVLPDYSQRVRIWRNLIPEDAEVDEGDIRDLAKDFELSGSNIKEIVVNGAYFAAGDQLESIDMGSIVRALKLHCAKHNKSMDSSIWGKYEIYL